ncbi:hypothetical protein ACG83_30080 [Frankia sp. R43]|uniref:hypothetical protein n=1 Tax=Frankia sp. R43 TaxID=269536 RepID=UPI0006CA0426|nr:hypothetical protein [Frankia sp. R43]KPM52556.1 hypothetical protein ACG83_30080 [Frankia sp. R43]
MARDVDLDRDLADITDLAGMLGISRSRADTVSRMKGFPDPAFTRPRIRLWWRADVEAWADRNRPGWRGDT